MTKDANIDISVHTGKPRIRVRAGSMDGLANLAHGLGDPLKDKLAGSSYQLFALNRQEVTNAYMSSWLSRRIVDIPADDMTSKIPEITLGAGKDAAKAVTKEIKRRGVMDALNRCQRWANLYGGAIGIIVTKNAAGKTDPLDSPLDVTKLQKGCFANIIVTDRWAISKGAVRIADPGSPDIGDAEVYQVAYIDRAILQSTIRVHHSRIMKFRGNKVPAMLVNYYDGWGDSVLTAAYDAIRGKDAVSGNMNRLTYEATIDAVNVPNLGNKLSSPEGESSLLRRFQVANLIKGINSLMILDGGEPGVENSGEKLTRSPYSFTGLKDVWEGAAADVAGAVEIPLTRLFGRSATGLNATGNNDMRVYYERIARDQAHKLNPALDILLPVIVRSVLGAGEDDFDYTHPSLETWSKAELSEIEKRDAERDKIYADMGAITGGLVARELDIRGTYQAMTDDDVKAAEAVGDEEGDEDLLTDPENEDQSEADKEEAEGGE